jgi:inositol hexakisphosphate/diphosphoinositol-pentakisphosphate kinase
MPIGIYPSIEQSASASTTSTLRATVTVLRHADRTPKMKLKFSFPAHEAWTKPFLRLLRGHREEIILRDPRQLAYILSAAEEAEQVPGLTPEILLKLAQLKEALGKKMSLAGTKAQLKPSFEKKEKEKKEGKEDKKDKKEKKEKKEKLGSDDEDDLTETERSAKVKDWLKRGTSDVSAPTTVLINGEASQLTSEDATPSRPRTPERAPTLLPDGDDDANIPEGLEKMQLVVKWGGESTHSSRYQSRDLGDAFKKVCPCHPNYNETDLQDIMIMSR